MKLLKLADNRMKVILAHETFEGSKEDVLRYLRMGLEVDDEEVCFALEELWLNSHDVAHFGVNLMFTHTSNLNVGRQVEVELKTLAMLREEYMQAYKNNPEGQELREIGNRLFSMYAALNVGGIMQLLNIKEDKKAS